MTVTLELRPEEVAVLRDHAQADASRTGGSRIETVSLEAVLQRIAAQLPAGAERPPLTDKQKAAVALMNAWREEDQTDDPEELARRDQELEDFKANMNRWRAEEGRLPVYQ